MPDLNLNPKNFEPDPSLISSDPKDEVNTLIVRPATKCSDNGNHLGKRRSSTKLLRTYTQLVPKIYEEMCGEKANNEGVGIS